MSKIYYEGNSITQAKSDNLFNLGYVDLSKKGYFESLELILCKADGTEISVLKEAYNIKLNLHLHDIDELDFDLPYYIEEQYMQTQNYNWKETEDCLLIKLNNKTMFIINNISENGNEINTKHIHAYSKEYLLSFRKLSSLLGTRQLYRDGSETATSRIAYSLDNTTWINYTSPFIAEDGKSILIRRYDHLNKLIGEYKWNNKDKFAQIDGIDLTYKDTDIFNKKVQISIRIISETGEGLLNLLEQETSWKIGYIDIDIREDRNLGQEHRKYRTFEINNAAWLDILYKTVPELFDCVVRIDSLNQIINIYHKDKFSQNKGLFISKENYLKSITKDLKNDDVITRLRIYGKDNLNISSVNPTGEEFLEDFTYYRNLKYMDYDLLQALDNYDSLKITKTPIFHNYLQQLRTLRNSQTILENQLLDLQMQKTQKEDLKDIAIQQATRHTQYDTTIDNITVDFSDIHSVDLSSYNIAIAQIQVLIDSKNIEINNLKNQIATVLTSIVNLGGELGKKNNFTTQQLKVLDTFVKEDVWENKNYDNTIDLFEAGEKALSKLSRPSIEFSISIVDFLNVVECQHDWDKLGIGDIINIHYDDFDLNIEAKIIKISHDVDGNNIDITISNNNELDDDAKYISDLIKNSTQASNTIDMFKHEWDLSGKNTDLISQIISNGLDSAKNRITGGRNQNIQIDERGIMMKDMFDDKEQLRIVNNVLAFTEDGWNTCSTAITPQGIVAQEIYGKIIGSNKLIITNMNDNGESSFLVDGSHMTATNMDLSLIRKNLLNRVYMNPEYGFKIQNRISTTEAWKDLLWLDMDGDIYAQSFHIINKDTALDDKGLVVDNGKIKIINNNNYDAFYADETGEMRLDGRLRVIRHLNSWTPSNKWDLEPESNRIILLDAYKDESKGGKILINDWQGKPNVFVGSAPSSLYNGGFFKIYGSGINERINLGVLASNNTGVIKIKNNLDKDIVSLSGNDSGGEISINSKEGNNIVSILGDNAGGRIRINGSHSSLDTNVMLGCLENDAYLDGGFLKIYNKGIANERVFIGIKKENDAGSIDLKAKLQKIKVSLSAMDTDHGSISSGVIKLFDSNDIATLLMYAETPLNISGREGSQDSALIIGKDKEHAKIGMYGGGDNTGALIELASAGNNSHGNFPNMSLGDLSNSGSSYGGSLVIYKNMSSNTHEERVQQRRIHLYVNGENNGEIDMYDSTSSSTPTGKIVTKDGELAIIHKSGSKVRFSADGKIYLN